MTQTAREPAAGPAPARRPRLTALPVLLTAGSAVGVALIALTLTGAFATVQDGTLDAGPLVHYGLPAFRALRDVTAALTIGLLITGAFLLPAEADGDGDPDRDLSGRRELAVRLVVPAASTWAVATLAVLVLTAADITGIPPGGPGSFSVLVSFVTQVQSGQMLALSLVLALVVANLAMLALRVATAGWATLLALLALLPLALSGHAAGSAEHGNAVNSLALHLLAASGWLGGLAALVLLSRRLGDALPVAAGRYSTLALGCFVAVAVSGLANAALRLGGPENLVTGYGALVLGKAVALIVLGGFGVAHRRWTLRRLDRDRHWFARLAAVELVVMGAAMGLAVALGRTPPPVPEATTDPVTAVIGFPAPPPITPLRYLTVFHADLLWIWVALALAGAYLAGVLTLRRRGDRWPLSRTLPWLAACVLLVFITSGGPGVYARLHFSTHMVQHMMLMVLVPFGWVLGAPTTLALRTLKPRPDGSLGARRILLGAVQSPVLSLLGRPVVAAGLFIVSLFAFYYTRLFDLAMATHTGHVLMTVHFLGVGYLFVWSLIGIDPGPPRLAYPLRMLVLLATIAFHAFFGVAMMSGSGVLLAPDYWASLGQTDTARLLADQQNGGAIAWGSGDLPSLLIGAVIFYQWFRDSHREGRRADRRADRDGDAELAAWNARMADLAQQDTADQDPAGRQRPGRR